jgi:3-phytase
MVLIGVLYSCISDFRKEYLLPSQKDSTVFARIETTPVASGKGDDAADDPAVWINFEDPSKSLIIGTNKKGGLCVYNLRGEEIHYFPIGHCNNVDIRYGFPLKGGKVDIVATTNRSTNALQILVVNPQNGSLTDITGDSLRSGLQEVYGVALYHSKHTGKYYGCIAGKDGGYEQWELIPSPKGGIKGKILRRFHIGTQCEGLVADDELGYLYIAEEDLRIWKYKAEPDSGNIRVLIPMSDSTNAHVKYDLEGLTIYYARNGKGYLIASSQGNNSYAIFERNNMNRYIGSFRIGNGAIDDVEETDGIDVCNFALGGHFGSGLFIVQDGTNTNGADTLNQNFKLVEWRQIARLFDPPLLIDSTYIVSGFN